MSYYDASQQTRRTTNRRPPASSCSSHVQETMFSQSAPALMLRDSPDVWAAAGSRIKLLWRKPPRTKGVCCHRSAFGVWRALFVPGLPLIKTHSSGKSRGMLSSTVIYMQDEDCAQSVKSNTWCVKIHGWSATCEPACDVLRFLFSK